MQPSPLLKTLNLKRALLANAVFSFISSIVFVAAPDSVARFVGLFRANDVRNIGFQLLAFAAFVFWVQMRLPRTVGWVRVIIAGDVLWVIGSAALLLLRPAGLTVSGNWAIAGVAVIVAGFATVQTLALRGWSSGESGAPGDRRS